MSTTELLPLILFAAVILITIVFMVLRYRKQKALLEEQMAKRGGQVGGGLSFLPRYTFQHGSYTVTVYSTPGGRYTPPHTHLNAPLVRPMSGSLTLRRTGLLDRLGGSDIQVGEADFDTTFRIKSDQPELVRVLLPASVQATLLALSNKSPTVQINAKGLYFSTTGMPRNGEDLDQFINTGLSLLNQLNAWYK
jgi:hypothetical protein